MKIRLLTFITIVFCSIVAFSQTSSDTCSLANSATPISGSGDYSVGAINGTAPTTICTSTTSAAANGEWFRYTPSSDYYITLTSNLPANTNKDTRLHVYSGDCTNLVCVAGNDDDTNAILLSTVYFSVQQGQTYYIAWDNLWDSSGFDFKLIETSFPPLVSFNPGSVSAPGTDRGAVDMNGDGLDDVVSISTSSITINFQETNGSFTKTTYSLSGASYSAAWSMAAGDYNKDGLTDMVYGNSNGAHVVKAVGSGNTITGFTIDATSDTVFTQRTNFVDLDNDGNLDIFICDDTDANEYLINDGTSLTLWEGDDPSAPISGGLGGFGAGFLGGNYGSVWIDYDNDGDSDLFIAKCGGSGDRPKNQFFRNNGNLSFTEISVDANMHDPVNTWSSAWADFDSDGDMDCFVGTNSSSESAKLMRNNLGTSNDFTDITSTIGLDYFTDIGRENQAFDFNNDGYVDIYSSGDILLNKGDGTFIVQDSGIPQEGAVGDLNNDGFLDIFNGSIYYNTVNSNHWINIQLVGTNSNKNGIGARIKVSSPSFNDALAKKSQIRDVKSAQGFAYMSTLNTHFGLGSDDTINTITVYWPSGTVDVLVAPSVDQLLKITEGETLSAETTLVNDLILYPNPTSGLMHLNSKYGLDNAIFSVFDMTGRRVMNNKLISNSIDVSELSSGNYILRILNNDVIQTQKFIKQ